MKKRNVLLPWSIALMVMAASILSISNSAYAYGVDSWGFDLSSYGGGTYTNVDRLSVDGTAVVTQFLGTNTTIDVGDTFTESGYLGIAQGYYEPGNFVDQFSLDAGGNHVYIYADGLKGKVTSVSATGYEYAFDLGVGSISMVVDDNLDYTDGVSGTLATFSLVYPSNGTNVGFLGGSGPNGTTDLTGAFLTAASGVFTWNGLDFSSLPPGVVAFGLLNTNNNIPNTPTQGVDPTTGEAYIQAGVHSGGQFGVDVVPEPASLLLLGIGIIGVLGIRKKIKI
jgi:hypothetical protein